MTIENVPPRPLLLAVALVAGAMLLVELIATRLFSVLFYYHYSFFAVSLVMSGLAFGGLLASRWNARAMSSERFEGVLGILALSFAAGVALALGAVLFVEPRKVDDEPELATVVLLASSFLPGLVASGAFLALAFARRESWIAKLYAADLAAAAACCAGAILLLRATQGPGALLVPAAFGAIAGALLGSRRRRTFSGAFALLCLGGLLADMATGDRVLRLRTKEPLLYESWNEHSRVVVLQNRGGGLSLVIDKIAGARIPRIGPPIDGRAPVEPWWDKSVTGLAYRLGRALDRVAIIGVGGGVDLLPPLANGAKAIDGYELNSIQIEILERMFRDWCHLADMPGVNLIHSEARVGIRNSGRSYDVIQASMIDTWAATAGGGFVLSENGLYTVEGWRTLLDALTPTGILTMTRWHIASAPAETRRLVSLASAALESIGISDPRSHVAIAVQGTEADARNHSEEAAFATILVSKRPFSEEEIGFLHATREEYRSNPNRGGGAPFAPFYLLAAPGVPGPDPEIDRLLDPATRAEAIARSEFDLTPTTDERPYFFLQVRPQDVLKLRDARGSRIVLEVTLNGIRVLMALVALSLTFAAGVMAFGFLTRSSGRPTETGRRIQRRTSVYFLCIGMGYMFVQIGLHQRLVLVLGSPTLALSAVLFSMLLGTGAGSALSDRLFRARRALPFAWIAILAVVGALFLVFPWIASFERIPSGTIRACGIGLMTGVVGCVLGFGFPLGVRLAAGAGELAIQKMWAVNGAASIAGSALAAATGVALGSRIVILAGFVCYAIATAAGLLAARIPAPSEAVAEAGEIADSAPGNAS